MTGVTVIGLKECQRDLDQLTKDLINNRKVLERFRRWWVGKVHAAWVAVKAPGGIFRGVKWEGMKPQYTRKTDGVTVPAWGGVPRVAKGYGLKRKGGNVKGRLRPSGQRVKQTSVMMQDTGAAGMSGDILNAPLALTDSYLEVGTSKPYAEKQDQMRPVVHWKVPEDENELGRIYQSAADAAIERRGFA
jgi:hypothetical protein